MTPSDGFIQLPADSTGKKLRTVDRGAAGHDQYLATPLEAGFRAVYDRIAPAANKYMATLFNTSATREVELAAIRGYNWGVAAVTGVLLEFELRKITARTQGTAITPLAWDAGDTLSSGITADHASTAVTEGGLWRRVFGASEEMKLGALTLENVLGVRTFAEIYDVETGDKPLTLRQNEGVTVKCITSSTIGTFSFVIDFEDVAV